MVSPLISDNFGKRRIIHDCLSLKKDFKKCMMVNEDNVINCQKEKLKFESCLNYLNNKFYKVIQKKDIKTSEE